MKTGVINITENKSLLQIAPHKLYLCGILLLSIAGGLLAFYGARLTYQLTGYYLSGPSGCYVNEWINCDSVLSTRFAKMFGIPVAWFGFLFYLLTAFLTLHALLTNDHKQTLASATLASFFAFGAVLFSLFKAYQLIQLKVLCPVCVGMYLINFSILFLLIKSLDIPIAKSGKFFGSYIQSFSGPTSARAFSHPVTLYGIFATWVFIIGFAGNYYLDQPPKEQDVFNMEKAITEHFEQTPVDLKIDANAAFKGNAASGVKIIEFSDFECPACRMLASDLPAILNKYQDEVSFYYMNYPLDKSINENVKRDIHEHAGIAAMAGVCAQNRGGFWSYYDSLFQTKETLDREYLLRLAKGNGWEREPFEKCMDAGETRQRVVNDIQAGKDAKVTGTPSLFINGRFIKYWNKPEFIMAVIDAELKKK